MVPRWVRDGLRKDTRLHGNPSALRGYDPSSTVGARWPVLGDEDYGTTSRSTHGDCARRSAEVPSGSAYALS